MVRPYCAIGPTRRAIIPAGAAIAVRTHVHSA